MYLAESILFPVTPLATKDIPANPEADWGYDV